MRPHESLQRSGFGYARFRRHAIGPVARSADATESSRPCKHQSVRKTAFVTMTTTTTERGVAASSATRGCASAIRGARSSRSGAHRKSRICLLPALLAVWLLSSGCASMISGVTEGLATDLSDAILNSDDLEVVRDGAPAYLIMLDALLRNDPDNPTLLIAAGRLNSAYSAAFVDDPMRKRSFAVKAFELTKRAACIELEWACDAEDMPFDQFEAAVQGLDERDVPTGYALATAWAGWIQANSDDWGAVAELGRVKTIVARVAELDEGYDYAGPLLYLAVFETLLPPALGGRPEVGRAHFERAIELSDGQYLMTKVMFAEQYGRLVFDRELHDRELKEVLESNPRIDGLTLINLMAQEQARALLESGDEYF